MERHRRGPLALRGHRRGDAGGEPGLRLAGEPLPPARLHLRHLPLLRRQPGRLLGAAGARAGGDGEHHRSRLLRLVQRLQPVRDDGVLGAHGRPLLAGAEQAALRRDRGGGHAGRDLRALAGDAAGRAARHRRRCCWSRWASWWPRWGWPGWSRAFSPTRPGPGAAPTPRTRPRWTSGRSSAGARGRASAPPSARPTCWASPATSSSSPSSPPSSTSPVCRWWRPWAATWTSGRPSSPRSTSGRRWRRSCSRRWWRGT